MQTKLYIVPRDGKGERIKMLDSDFKKSEPVASKRTHLLGLNAGVGNITMKQALCGAYYQGMYDLMKAQELGEDDAN